MIRKGVLLLTFLASINLISAGIIGDALDRIGGENLLLIGSFVISFALLNMILSKIGIFKNRHGESTNTPAIISFVISLFIIQGINTFNIDLGNFFFSLGISEELLFSILPLLILGGIIYGLYKLSKSTLWEHRGKLLAIAGIVSIWISGTDLVYEQGTLFMMGIALIILGFIFRNKKVKDVNLSQDLAQAEEYRRNLSYDKQQINSETANAQNELGQMNQIKNQLNQAMSQGNKEEISNLQNKYKKLEGKYVESVRNVRKFKSKEKEDQTRLKQENLKKDSRHEFMIRKAEIEAAGEERGRKTREANRANKIAKKAKK